MSTSGAVSVAAIDLGASSGRVMVGRVGRAELAVSAAARFANDPVPLPDGLHWDPQELYRQALNGLWTAVSQSPDGLRSVAVDSWAVDYALVRDGRLWGTPFHYRDGRTAAGVERIHARVPFDQLYERTGLQFLPFNTVYQLAAEPELRADDRALLIPDLIGWWLTGEQVTERTNASTTGLLDPRTGQWDLDLFDQVGVPRTLFADLVDPGTTIGKVRPEVGERIGAPDLAVSAVGSHDTASAVVGVPLLSDDAAFLSCGTWGLVGLELDAPVLTDAARAANFTNEGGVDGTTRFLTNVMGTWLLSESIRTWERDGQASDLVSLLTAAADVPLDDVTLFDVQDPVFAAPGDMPSRIVDWCVERGLRAPVNKPVVVRSIVESLAAAYGTALHSAAELAGRTVRTVHVVGGGSQNTLLCQAIANHSGIPVVAGPVEATALGNLLVQARTLGAVGPDLVDLRELIDATHTLTRYEPRSDERHS